MRFTASKAALLERCQWWARDDVRWIDTGTSEAAEEGNLFHAYAEAYVNHGIVPRPAEAVAARWERAQEWLDRERSGTGALGELVAEHAYAWDPTTDTARLLGVNIGRAYTEHGAQSHELCGSVDLMWHDPKQPHGVPLVWDWKTGRKLGGAMEQVALLSMMVQRVHRSPVVVAGVLHAKDDELATPQPWELDEMDLAAVAGNMQVRLTQIHTSEPQPGAHCSDLYCPARATCPAINKALNEVVSDRIVNPSPDMRMSLDIQGPAHAAWMLGMLDSIHDATSAITSRLKAYADANNGIEIPHVGTWSGQEASRESPDLSDARAVTTLHEMGAGQALKFSTSWSAIEMHAGKVQAKAIKARLIELGAVKRSTFRQYETRTVKKPGVKKAKKNADIGGIGDEGQHR